MFGSILFFPTILPFFFCHDMPMRCFILISMLLHVLKQLLTSAKNLEYMSSNIFIPCLSHSGRKLLLINAHCSSCFSAS
jgi:hypothetical protein